MRLRASPSSWAIPKETSCIAPDDVQTNKGPSGLPPSSCHLHVRFVTECRSDACCTDMDPSPPEYRTYTSWTFFAYWVSDLVNPGSWSTVASFVALGLTWWESCLAVFVGSVLVAIVITANGIIGAKCHTPFAVTSRATFGYWGRYVDSGITYRKEGKMLMMGNSKFVVFSRMVIAWFWLSINSWSGGQLVSLMILAIWPSYANLANHVPTSQGATSRDFLSFFLFWWVFPTHCLRIVASGCGAESDIRIGCFNSLSSSSTPPS